VTALIWHIFAIDFEFAAWMLVNFLKVLPALIVETFAAEDDAGTGAQIDGLRQQLEDETQVAALGERYATDEAFRREFNATLHQVLWAVAVPPEGVSPATAEATQRTGTMGEETTARLQDIVLRQVAQTKLVEQNVEVVIFGHTHNPLCERLNGGMYLNVGTWVWWRNFAGMGLETWKEFYAHPEDFVQPHYLTYVRVDYDKKGRLQAQLLDYTGQLAIECPKPTKCKLLAWLAGLWVRFVEWFGSLSF
jgi:hypothetical protein